MRLQQRVTNSNPTTGNIIRDSALGVAPETLLPYLELNQKIWHAGPLNAAEIEMARLRNAQKVNCVMCKSVRYDIARDAGLSEDRVQMINDDFQNSTLTDREKLVITYTDCYIQNPAGLSDELKAGLRAEFSAEELAHLSLAIALFSAFSRCAVALGGMPESLPVTEIAVPD